MTTHYQKIQALGNKMASNLETMGVSASFNDGGLTLADKILQIQHFTNGLLLSADKSVDQSGNTVKLTALLMENGETVSGKRVYFHKSGEVVKYTSSDHPNKNIGESWVIKATASNLSNYVTIGSDSYSIYFFPASGTIQIWSQGSMVIEKTGGDSYLAYNNGNLYYNGETIDISSYGAPTKVKSVTAINSGGLSVDYGVIGWGTTDSYGVATASYTCTGAGKKTITAVSGSVVSETYEIMDAVIYDKGLEGTGNHNDNCWGGLSDFTVSRGADGTTVENSTSSNKYLYPKSSNSAPYREWIQDYALEFTYLEYTGTAILRIDNGTNKDRYLSSLSLTSGDVVKVEVSTEYIKYFKNGEELTSFRTAFSEGASYIAFIINNGSMKFRDFRVYPI